MSSHYLDFSSCGIVPGFCKSGHIYSLAHYYELLDAYDIYSLCIGADHQGSYI